MAALMDLLGPFDEIGDIAIDNTAVSNVSGIIYSAYILVLLVSGVVPALYLNAAIRNRIAKFEGDGTLARRKKQTPAANGRHLDF